MTTGAHSPKPWLALTMAVLVAVTACTSSAPDESSANSLPENEFVTVDKQWFIDEALKTRETHPPGVSDQQLRILTAAVDVGELSYDDYSAAVDNEIQCLEDAGYAVTDLGTEERIGTLFRSFRMVPPPGITEQQEDNLSTDCNIQHTGAIEAYYTSQPSSQQKYLDKFEEQRDSILKCLKGLGYETDADSTAKELLYRVSEASFLADTTCYTGTYFAGFLDPEREEEIMAEYRARQGSD